MSKARKVVHWSLIALVAAYLLTGFGITQHSTVEALTLGLLTTNLAFVIHEYLWIPFLIVLVIHVALTLNSHRRK